MNLDDLLNEMSEKIRNRDLSDEYLREHNNSTREEIGIGEYAYGITMIPCEWVYEYLSDYKRVLKENEILKEEKEQAWEEWNNLEQGSYETELKLKEENRELKAEMKDGVIAIKLYALQTENEKLKKKIDLMENYMVENGWEICFDNIYAELNNCNGMERDWCRGDKLEKQDIHKYFSKKLLESEE